MGELQQEWDPFFTSLDRAIRELESAVYLRPMELIISWIVIRSVCEVSNLLGPTL